MSSPAHKPKLGNFTAVVWRNLGERGNWYAVQLTRSYKTDDGRRNTDNLGYDDLLAAAKLLDLAHTWIGHQRAADDEGRKQADNATAK
jgi:hypothetical protein